jgi:4-carboxymuconolactone decarboxylase
MERWMVVEGYGKVLGRPQLDLPTRELCIVALLAVLGMPRQLHSHLRGALNAGATLEEVEVAMRTAWQTASEMACGQGGGEGCKESWATWEGVRTRWTNSK